MTVIGLIAFCRIRSYHRSMTTYHPEKQPMPQELRTRLATLDDIPTIIYQRHAMFAEMGSGTPESLDQMDIGFAGWLREKMPTNEYLGWFALSDDEAIIAGVGLWVQDWPVGPVDQTGRRGYVMNVYTEPPYRGQRLAPGLVQVTLDYSRSIGLETVLLNASDAGRPVYEKLGFRPSAEMRLSLV
jgi:GNAT superfamily N-acetyltransferase